MLTVVREIVERDELASGFCLERVFIERWVSSAAQKDFADGVCAIPAMPHLTGLGKGIRFHVPSVREWLLKYFQRGGDSSRSAGKP